MAERKQSETTPRDLVAVARRVGPWVLLFVMVLWVYSLYGQYKASTATYNASGRSAVTTSSAETTASKKPSSKSPASKSPAVKPGASKAASSGTAGINAPSQVRIVADVNLHDQPNASANVIRVLKSGETLTVVGQSGSWYKVTDSSGAIGYVTQSTQYTKLIPAK